MGRRRDNGVGEELLYVSVPAVCDQRLTIPKRIRALIRCDNLVHLAARRFWQVQRLFDQRVPLQKLD